MSDGDARPLAILGGTFDPVHIGHLRIAWEAGEALHAEVRLIPANVPPHRPQPVASPAQRAALLRKALAGQDRLVADERELRRAGPSYTHDTLAELRAEIGPRRPLVLLVGADAAAGLPSWHRWRELFGLAHVAVLNRPGSPMRWSPELAAEADARAAEPSDLRTSAAGRWTSIAVTPLDISASRVRALLAAGRDPRWLLPEALCVAPELAAIYAAGAR